MVDPEFDFQSFELTAEAQRDEVMLAALAVPADERWRNLGENNPQLGIELLILRKQLEVQGVQPLDIATALASFVNETHRIGRTRDELRHIEAAQVPEASDTVEAAVEPIEKARRHRWRGKRMARLGAALVLLRNHTQPGTDPNIY